ncbi:uncharacterized protein LACBIDRAFT_332021 [Laccaria bicolor S238N-H82]|uniref:Predicted protein n=1 Tax=Laccaria bicolor (strain S238N-H82 / ATCC MYA-4686) TaxID=486041 RepID=B0DRB2_LACBS|nr:uncharacterized protein LACBIDRAFT_332021 [Laccaria bicolor S238N-H82]EDR02754.1 predicted protein [Laccaria bicolor S238N-H82]|eukprot:XP_001886464.1 predicted protein [Laccaria bicolor S238N-H82]
MSEVSSKMSDLHWLLQNSRIVIIVREIYAVDNLEPAPDAFGRRPYYEKRRYASNGAVIIESEQLIKSSTLAVEGPSNETPVLERLAPDTSDRLLAGGNTSNGGNACGIRIQGNGSVRMEGRNSFGVSGSKNSTGIAVDDSGRVEMTATSDTSLDVNGQGNVYGMRTRDIGAARMEGRSDIVVSGSQNATGIAVENSSRVKMTPTSDTRIRVNGQDRRPLGTFRKLWLMWLGCGEKGIDLSKDVVVVESEAKVLPTLLMASTSHLKCLTRTHISDIFSSELAGEDRSVDVGTVGRATNSVVLEEQSTWICGRSQLRVLLLVWKKDGHEPQAGVVIGGRLSRVEFGLRSQELSISLFLQVRPARSITPAHNLRNTCVDVDYETSHSQCPLMKDDRRMAMMESQLGYQEATHIIYYRLYTKDGPLESNSLIYSNDHFISRIVSSSVRPPHTAASLMRYLCKMEGLALQKCILFQSLSELTALENSIHLPLRGTTGPGASDLDPMALVVDKCPTERRSQVTSGVETQELFEREQRYVYYRVYDDDGEIVSKRSFDENNPSLGRVNTLSVPPPHTVSSLKNHIVISEGLFGHNVKLFEDEGNESAMNDSDALTLLSETFPGCIEDRPIAITYESGTENGSADNDDPNEIQIRELKEALAQIKREFEEANLTHARELDEVREAWKQAEEAHKREINWARLVNMHATWRQTPLGDWLNYPLPRSSADFRSFRWLIKYYLPVYPPDAQQSTKFSTFALEGGSRACRISIYNSTVQFKGKNAKIDIAGFHESYGIVMKGGSKVDMEFGNKKAPLSRRRRKRNDRFLRARMHRIGIPELPVRLDYSTLPLNSESMPMRDVNLSLVVDIQ